MTVDQQAYDAMLQRWQAHHDADTRRRAYDALTGDAPDIERAKIHLDPQRWLAENKEAS